MDFIWFTANGKWYTTDIEIEIGGIIVWNGRTSIVDS
jgi:hypothetical protein